MRRVLIGGLLVVAACGGGDEPMSQSELQAYLEESYDESQIGDAGGMAEAVKRICDLDGQNWIDTAHRFDNGNQPVSIDTLRAACGEDRVNDALEKPTTTDSGG